MTENLSKSDVYPNISTIKTCIIALLLIAFGSEALSQSSQFVYEGAEELPQVSIEGKPVKIHTQGLLVTQDFYLVAGRLETTPKRALLLRFSRKERERYEYLDITPRHDVLPHSFRAARLDHPGGFDADSKGDLYIPISTSHPRGPTLVYRFQVNPGKPLAQLRADLAFKVDDHIGAICCNHADDTLSGANWDTKQVYRWTRRGELMSRVDRSMVFPSAPGWQLAIQDWKGLRRTPEMVIAGGIDKSKGRTDNVSRAVVQFLDLTGRKVVSSHRIREPKNATRHATNEGLCWFNEKLYLLPEDIGRGAKVLRYRRDER